MFPIWSEAYTQPLIDSTVRILVTPMSHIFGSLCPLAPEGWFQDLLWQEQSGGKF